MKAVKDLIGKQWSMMRGSQIWQSIFRHGYPSTVRNRSLAVLTNVFLHLHPVRARKPGIRLKYTWCMGGLTFFLFLVEVVTGILLMFYYRPVPEYAYVDMLYLREDISLGVMRERWRIVLADDGQILVDKSKKFQYEKGEWDDPESFLTV